MHDPRIVAGTMPKSELIYYVATSLDGFIATADGGIDWLAPFEGGAQDYGYAAFIDRIDAVVMGSATYEKCLGFGEWPYAGKRVWVLSSRDLDAADADVTITPDEPDAVMREIAAQGLRRVWLAGGGMVAGEFRRHGLITGYIVSVIPVVLGNGIPLLGHSGDQEQLELLESRAYPDGIVQLHYRPLDPDTLSS
ncbi:MAG: dihydrofolate reductase family protein [Rhodocyclaceae bacterium]